MAQPLPISREVERMCSYLASLSYTVTRDWLTGCVEYFRNENSHYSVSDLQEFVRKQWELSDLRDSSGGSLPPNLQNQMKITLRGKYAVQIESVLNISEPAYTQMQKIRKVDVGNVEVTEKKQESWEPRAGRMLKLKLCDGQQQAEAIEYRPLRMLNEHILPGSKILIIGPVDCRRGIFFLKPENVKLIGGEVDSLLIVNHMENVLARALGLPENQDPFSTASDASATQLSAPAVSDSQRSTYTPTVSATPAAAPGPSGRQLNRDTTGRSMTQQRIQDMFRNRPTQAASEDALDTSLDGTGWTVDDLLAEGDDAFLELAEERTEVAISSSTTSSTSRLVNDSPTEYSPGQRRRNDSSTTGENSVFKVPQVPVKNSKENSNRKAVSKSSNPFLADDAYIDAFDMEWEEEEINEFLNVSLESTSSLSSSKNASQVKNYNKSESSTSKIVNTSSFKWPEMPQNNMRSKQFCVGRSVSEPVQKNNFSSGSSSSGSTMRPNSINQEMKEGPGRLGAPTNMQNSRSSTASSSKNSNSKLQFLGEYSSSVHSKESLKKINFNKSTSKHSPNKQQTPKTIDQQSPKKTLSSPPDVFEDDEDWADAYLSSHNSSFINKFEDPDKLSSLKSISNYKDFPSPGSLKRPSLLVDDANGTKKVSFGGSSEPKVSHQSSESVGDRRAFVESRSHLRPALSSPSCITKESEISVKAPEARCTSSCSSINSKPSTSSSSSSPSTVILPSNSKLDSATPPKQGSLKSPEPFEYLEHILKSPTKTSRTHRIKAKIMTLLSQLKVESGYGWSLSVKLCDGTATLDVQFSPLVLDEIIGMSAQEFKKLKRDIPNNPLLKEKLVKKLERTREILMKLNCFFDIKFEAGKMAQVVQISEITEQDDKLKSRLKDS